MKSSRIHTKLLIFCLVLVCSFSFAFSSTLDEQQNQFEFSEKAINNPLTQQYIKTYSTGFGKKHLVEVMENSKDYRSYVQEALIESNLPSVLQYLPVIESDYKITAKSKSGAKGLWQFMPNSIGPFGLRINNWMDERIDPWLSTDAAVKKLKENYDALGSWELALAAYNFGLGAVKKAVKEGQTDDFWLLCEKGLIRTETKNYVPKFIAVCIVLENKLQYGLFYDEPDYENDAAVKFDTLKTNCAVDLEVLAQQSGIGADVLAFYNPALFFGITPSDMEYTLRVPEGTKDLFAGIIETNSKNQTK